MKLYEYEVKNIFKLKGIPIPDGNIITSTDDSKQIEFEKELVLKAQILAGGRGKAGGIKFAKNKTEFFDAVNKLLGMELKGFIVKKILVEEKIEILKEIYLGLSIDQDECKILLLASKEGGIDIEEIAKLKPESILRYPIDILDGISTEELKKIFFTLKLDNSLLTQFLNIANSLYEIFIEYEAEFVEINPLVITKDNKLIAADARMAVYDEALNKHPELIREDDTYTDIEKESRKIGLGYVQMDGDIGVIGNGAGLNMATLDILAYYKGKPANFLEVSGRTYHKAKEALKLILSNPNVKIVFGNFFGCISRCDVIAKGLAEAINEGVLNVPFVVSMRGTGAEEGIKTLKEVGVKYIYKDDKIAGKKVVDLLKNNVHTY